MIKTVLSCVVALVPVAAFAGGLPRTEPAVQALGNMVQECTAREAMASTRAIALQDQVVDLDAELQRQRKRADEAEAKIADMRKIDEPRTLTPEQQKAMRAPLFDAPKAP